VAEVLERLEIAELRHAVVREHECIKTRRGQVKGRRERGHAVIREEERAEAPEEREVAEDSDGVVGEIYAIMLVLRRC
jgi:hypothetical protein